MPSLHLYKIVKVLHEHTPCTEIQTTLRHPLPHLQRGRRAGDPGQTEPSVLDARAVTTRAGGGALTRAVRVQQSWNWAGGSTAVICPVPGSLGPLRLMGFPLIPDVLMTQPGAPRPNHTREQPGGGGKDAPSACDFFHRVEVPWGLASTLPSPGAVCKRLA